MMDWVQTDRHQVARRQKTTWRSLVRKSEFQQVYAAGVKLVGRLVVVYLLDPVGRPDATPAPTPDLARAVVASKKIGNAVARNRAKRLLREAHRLGVMGQPGQVRQIRERFLREPDEGSPPAAAGGTDPVNRPAAAAGDPNTFTGLWVVLVARQRILAANSREVCAELDSLLAGTDPTT